jgi:GAF domain-containing protein
LSIDDKSIAGYVASRGGILNIPDTRTIPGTVPYSFDRSYDERNHYETHSILAMPLTAPGDKGEKVLGVLQLVNHKEKSGGVSRFKADEELSRFLASQAAAALYRAQLELKNRSLLRDMRHLRLESDRARNDLRNARDQLTACGPAAASTPSATDNSLARRGGRQRAYSLQP